MKHWLPSAFIKFKCSNRFGHLHVQLYMYILKYSKTVVCIQFTIVYKIKGNKYKISSKHVPSISDLD